MSRASTRSALKFTLDPGSGVPVYRQIIKQVENAVLSGRVSAGGQLPTIRALAVALKINPITVSKAYNELEIRGILNTQAGSGTFVAENALAPGGKARERKARETASRFLREMGELGLPPQETLKLLKEVIALAPSQAHDASVPQSAPNNASGTPTHSTPAKKEVNNEDFALC
jgi:GntR family transcriptional regulator